MLSKSCQDAVQAILYLSICEKNIPIPVKEIAEKLKLPKEFVAKLLQKLVKYNIVCSVKGINGGFFLQKNIKEIYIIDIIKAIDGEDFLDGCVLGFEGCSDEKPCPIHNKWKICKKELIQLFSSETINNYEDIIKNKVGNLKN